MRVDHWSGALLGGCSAALLYWRLSGGIDPFLAAADGALIGALVLLTDAGLRRSRSLRALRRQPPIVYLPLAHLAILAAIILGEVLGGILGWSIGLAGGPMQIISALTGQGLLYAFCVSLIIVFASRVRDIVGGEALLNLLLGRYYKPILEDRVFMFIDVVGSTRFAETYGNQAAQAWLGAIVR